MRKVILLLAGVAVAAGLVLVKRSRPAVAAENVDELAKNLQKAWADHHTVV